MEEGRERNIEDLLQSETRNESSKNNARADEITIQISSIPCDQETANHMCILAPDYMLMLEC